MIAFHSHAVRRYNLFTAWALQPVYCLGPVLFRSYKIDPAAALAHALGVCNIATKSDLLDQKSINRLTVLEEDRLLREDFNSRMQIRTLEQQPPEAFCVGGGKWVMEDPEPFPAASRGFNPRAQP